MGDGAADVATLRSLYGTLFGRLVPGKLRQGSLRIRLPPNPMVSSSTRPSYLTSCAVDALHRFSTAVAGALERIGQGVMWKSTWTSSLLILSLGE